jgi:NADH-quinone oxidoreductase subunit M
LALPGLNGFIGEFLILLGAFAIVPYWTVAAAVGMILGPIYMLWMFRRVVFGPLSRPDSHKLLDLDAREVTILVPILFLIFFMGIYPDPFLRRMRPAIQLVLEKVEIKKLARSEFRQGIKIINPAETGNGTQHNSSSPRG